MNFNKQKLGIYIGVIFALVFFACAIASPILLTKGIIKDLGNYGTTGDALGGLTNPFLAATGIIVTFLAFYIQYQANQQQLKQINDSRIEQNDLLKQQIFFKLMDNQQQRIFNLSKMNPRMHGPGPDITGTAALDSILKTENEDFKVIGKEILSSDESILEYAILEKIFQSNINPTIGANIDFKPLIEQIIAFNTYQSRLKAIDGYLHINKEQVLDSILNSIGRYYFFYAPSTTKLAFLKRRYNSITSQNQTFIDGYIKGFEHIVLLLKDKGLSKDNSFIDYLKYNLTIGEQKILFLYFASGHGKPETKTFVLENELLLDLCNYSFLSNHENYTSLMKEEVRVILSN